jgi:PAS domain S-box-containing protein
MHPHPFRALTRRLVRSRALAWTVLGLGMLLTLGLALATWRQALTAEQQRFAYRIADARAAISGRFAAYEQVLLGGAGLLRAYSSVPRDAWATYVASLELSSRYPGFQALGYALWVPAGGAAALENAVRAAGTGDLRIWPEVTGEGAAAILYLEPDDAVNQRALGYDMYSEATRRAAMATARDTGAITTSGAVRLVQDASSEPGFLMYLPHYGPGPPPADVGARRRRLNGWVYAGFRAADFLAPLAGLSEQSVRMQLFGGATADPAQLLFDSQPGEPWPQTPYRGLAEETALPVPGGRWTVRFAALPTLAPASDMAASWLVLGVGTATSLLAFAALQSAYARSQAEARSARLGRIIEDAASEVYVFDACSLAILQANRGARSNSGYTARELRRMSLPDLEPDMSRERFAGLVAPLTQHRSRHVTVETLHRRKDGSCYQASVTLQFHPGPRPVFHAIVADVTERRRAAEALERALQDTRQLLEQKETLLREVHHRVRNNLQVIWSLVRLEAAEVQEPVARRRMEKMGRRIGVLGQIHQQLYAVDTEARVDMGQQLDLLCRTLGALHQQRDIHLDTELDPVLCDLDTAVPLGLIANELVSNCFEHAFANDASGRIMVRLKRTEAGLELTVADSGIGTPLPVGAAKGLGLRMIEALVRQIGGEMETTQQEGTLTRVSIAGQDGGFPVASAAGRAAEVRAG